MYRVYTNIHHKSFNTQTHAKKRVGKVGDHYRKIGQHKTDPPLSVIPTPTCIFIYLPAVHDSKGRNMYSEGQPIAFAWLVTSRRML